MRNICQTINLKRNTIFRDGRFLLAVSLVVLSFSFFSAASVSAATSTVRGIGWFGDNYQEVYFNCLDDKIGDRLDEEGNLYNSPEPLGFHFYSEPCRDLVHGVYIDGNNNFSGKAWNPIKGLISFAGATTPPDGYGTTSSNCAYTCNASNNCWACYSEATQKIYGWARVDSDGTWIRLDSELTPAVSLQNCNATSILPGNDIQSGDFVGNASSTIGSLSFNCKSELGGNTCSTRNYEVYISNLTVGNLVAPDWTYAQACNSTALGATLRWCKRSGTQTAYEVAVSTNSTLSTSTAVCWSGIKYSDFASQYNLPNSDPTCGSLAYNTNYYWWINLYDENNEPTGWYQYNTNSISSTDGNPDSNSLTFTTYKHEFPSPFFTWSPYEPKIGSSTIFSGVLSQFYTSGSPSTPQSCYGANCRYLWETDDARAIISSTTTATTSIIFDTATGTTITLLVRDSDDYYCSTSTILRINYELPIWREIKAK